jgi:MFS family permease
MVDVHGGGQPASEDDERWVDAESILDGAPTESARRRMRRMRRMFLSLVVGLGLVGGLVGGVVGALISDGDRTSSAPDRTPGWQETTGLVVAAVGLVVMVVGLVLLWRSVGWRPIWRLPMAALTRAQRRQLSKEVRGRAPAHPRHLRVARDLATRVVEQRGLLTMLIGAVALWLGLAITTPSTWRLVYTVVLVALYIPGGVSFVRNRRRMREFLDRNREPAAP